MFSISKNKSISLELFYHFIFVLWFYLIGVYLFEITPFGHLSIGVRYIQVCLINRRCVWVHVFSSQLRVQKPKKTKAICKY